jgi:hypothetical protein
MGRRAGPQLCSERVAMVLQWLSSPVVWTLIVLVMSGLGIFRELF